LSQHHDETGNRLKTNNLRSKNRLVSQIFKTFAPRSATAAEKQVKQRQDLAVSSAHLEYETASIFDTKSFQKPALSLFLA
jgi:hypothetical protein